MILENIFAEKMFLKKHITSSQPVSYLTYENYVSVTKRLSELVRLLERSFFN